MVARGLREIEPAPSLVEPAKAPFTSYISGVGIIETSDDIDISAPKAGLVEAVFVEVGDEIEKGDPLFRLDTREAQATVKLRRADVDVAAAQVKEANANLADKQSTLVLAQKIQDKRAISVEELDRRRFAVQVAEAELIATKAQLRKALAEVQLAEVELEMLTVRSPIDGVVLQSNIEIGEYASVGNLAEPAMMVGTAGAVEVRVDIDENDAWRFRPGAPAVGTIRGHPSLEIPLTYVLTEPYVIPKQTLVGDTTMRVDTRVLQVVYRCELGNYPVYVGQQMDVWIEAPPLNGQTNQ